ncbi:MAG: NADH-quinone oxidoreductase subunit A [Chloroflexota bacterium]|jgi:NADH-quinone oxidoreductase subunit A|nr:MAG: NADH-quinone oxidoreductase subunit A [Chloroflexota bacterium]|tara:strand:+ start:20599 stop:20994 length:396 start_codon:yes stop_codon:yes gene_type:complete
MLDDYFRQYGLITIFALIAVAIPVGMLLVSTTLSIVGIRPDKPDEVKKSIYECGFETLSKRWSGFNSRFYAIALVFVVFDVEVVFLFPWASEFGYMSSKFGAFVLIEMAIFVAILLVGWLYAYRKGDLEWT